MGGGWPGAAEATGVASRVVAVDQQAPLPTCYRHPDRETRLGCSSCERPICVECMRQGSVGQKCPECARPEGRSRVITADRLAAEGRRTAPFSYGVVGIAVALFVVQLLVRPVGDVLYEWGQQVNILVAEGQVHRLLSSTLLHDRGSLFHVGFNMWALTVFGPPLEREVGTPSFAALYVASGLAGGAAFYLAAPLGVAVGASGAIFGLFGAWLVMSVRDRRTVQGRANLNMLLLLLAINLGISFVPGLRIAWQAHLGGLVAGVAIMAAWVLVGARGPAARIASAAAVGVLAVGAVIVG
jgi:membrane associated rhomboid family serine protease